MSLEQVPPLFFVAFFAAFVANAAYIACCFLLDRRLSASGRSVGVFSSGPGGTFAFLRFVFGAGHLELRDGTTTRLVLAVRVLFVISLALTLGVFAFLASIYVGGAA